MRELVIEDLMNMINEGWDVYGKAVEPIQERKTLEAMSNRELLDLLISTVEFQG